MKFLRVLINSVICGIFFSALLSLLISDLNINLNLDLIFFGQLTLFLYITYGLLISFLCFLLFFLIQFFHGRRIEIAIISPSFLSISFSLLIFLFLLIFRVNHNYFLSLFNTETRSLLSSQSTALLFLAFLGFIAFYFFHRYKKNILFYLIYFLIFGAVITFTLYQRFIYLLPLKPAIVANLQAKEINKRITIIGFEGLSFDFIIPLINEGKLPNFSWFIEKGSWGKLENFSPNEPIILNSSFNTGKLPAKHRQFSLFKYRLLNVNREIEVPPRFILFRQLTRTGLLKMRTAQPTPFTKDIWNIFEDNRTSYLKRDWPYQRNIEKPSQKTEKTFNLFFKDLKYETTDIFNIVRQAFYRDCEYEEKVFQEKNKFQPQLVYFQLDGLNVIEKYFYKYSFPDLFGNIEQEDINKYSSVIERYYEFYEQIIGKYLASLKEDELLVVYSPHGIEPLPLWKRFVEWILGNPEISAYHEYAPEGVIFFYGKDVARGKHIGSMNLIDIAPTLLNYLGLPVGKDMDGIVNSTIFEEEFKIENPVLYISSYEEIVIKMPE